MKAYRTYSSEETRTLGNEIAKRALRQAQGKSLGFARDKYALILALKGDLGAGKTTFAQGFLRGLGVRGRVNSPTFVLMKRFKIKSGGFKNAYHIDCYRVKKSAELSSLGLKEIFENPENIVLVEWPEKLKKYLPKDVVWVGFGHGREENKREIDVI